MTDRKITNLPASIRQRLLEVAQHSARPFQEVLQYYAMERFLYRLSVSPHADKFILKGGLMLRAWGAAATRPTRDIDLLGYLPNEIESLMVIVGEICRQEVEDDALSFDPTTVSGHAIKEDADYAGVRLTLRGSLQNMPIPMQIDIGFGDVVFPVPRLTEYPVILSHPSPKLRGYSREAAIAEKFEAMVKLGLLNSRMKDFFDIWLLSQQFDFDGAILASSIQKTFANRGTTLVTQPTAFKMDFAADTGKAAQWQAFVRRLRTVESAPDLTNVCKILSEFLSAPTAALIAGTQFDYVWPSGGPWTAK